MDQINHTHLISGFNERKQLQLAVQAAQKMVGEATMNMDPELMDDAKRAISDAKRLYDSFVHNISEFDQDFLEKQNQLLQKCEHQLEEAYKEEP
ncbi:DUF2564 family protein [Bacillus alveayuensis]|jgi:hypothetical protein|uniref:DUF2564 family protein n=1 Tax=Aeribacillus alveayuensis TaxID=279215 RepID=UPI0005D104D5|nr:DUF2564 family protein [Bacillus alveayuensis]